MIVLIGILIGTAIERGRAATTLTSLISEIWPPSKVIEVSVITGRDSCVKGSWWYYIFIFIGQINLLTQQESIKIIKGEICWSIFNEANEWSIERAETINNNMSKIVIKYGTAEGLKLIRDSFCTLNVL